MRDRASLFVMGNQCSGPNRIELTSGTWLSPAHISLAALNRPASSLAATFLTHATLPLRATPAEQDALRFPLLWTHQNMIQDEKIKTFAGGLSIVKPKTPQDKGEGDMINRTWLDQGWDSDAHS